MHTRTARILSLCLAISMAAGGAAQTAPGRPGDAELEPLRGQLVLVRTEGGGDFQGRLFGVLPDRVELLDGEGRIIALARDGLASIEALDGGRDPAEYFQDSASNRLVLMPTGFGMEPGEFHVAAQEIIVITTSYGISRNFSVWGGVSVPGGIVNLRWSTALGDSGGLSLGSFAGTTWMDPYAGVLLPYALASFGHPNRNLTLGLGVPFSWWSGESIEPVGAVGAIGGKMIVSATASIVTENWIIAISPGWTWDRLNLMMVPAVVFRIAGSRFSWDIGAVLPMSLVHRDVPEYEGQPTGLVFGGLGEGSVFPFPILSVTYRID